MYVRNCPCAKTKCVDEYNKPSLRDESDHFILQIGTNDLNSELLSQSDCRIDNKYGNIFEN